jgi:hypothetical protein
VSAASILVAVSLTVSYTRTNTNRFLIKYLGTHGGEVYPPAVQELATTAVLSAIKSPVSAFSDRNALLEVSDKMVPCGVMSCQMVWRLATEQGAVQCSVVFMFLAPLE